MPGSTTCRLSFQERSRQRRSHRQQPGRPRKKLDVAGGCARRPAADPQRARPPPEHRSAARDHRPGREARRASGSRLPTCSTTAGRCTTGGADADARAGRLRQRDRGGRARAAQGRPRPSISSRPTTTPATKALHGRLGARQSSTSRRPAGAALPCRRNHPGLAFDNVRERRLRDIWRNSPAFQAFRGTAWMREPCRSCERREVDWGGCRCQAFAFAGAAAEVDPACELSPLHQAFTGVAEQQSAEPAPAFAYRNPRAGTQ